MIEARYSRLLKMTVAATCFLVWSSTPVLADVVFDWATVGNPGNVGEVQFQGTFGAVDYGYRISKYEVTNAQYVEFLNKVAASDPNGLFDAGMDITQSGPAGSFTYTVNTGLGARPVNNVCFFDAMRFVNWLENGQPAGAQGIGTTEAGVYTIGTGTNETRAAGARHFIPSENEWYKAAYYDPRSASDGGPPGDDNYWLYPTQSDTAPTAEAPPGGMNSANFDNVLGLATDVGAYPSTSSFYGTFDQGGNVVEWNEAVFIFLHSSRGGGWISNSSSLRASNRDVSNPALEAPYIGFRVASVLDVPAVIAPDSFNVIRGEYVSGGLPELAASDNMDLSLRRLNTDTQSRTEFEIKSTSPIGTPSSFEFTLEGSVFARGNVVQTIELFDYVAAAWELVDTTDASRAPAPDSVVTVAATGDLSRFVEAGTMCIETRIRYKSDRARQNFASNTDQTIWTIGQ